MTKLFLASLLAVTSAGSALADVSYWTLNYPEADGGTTFLTGIREVGSTGNVYMTGVYTPTGGGGTQGLIYEGAVTGGGEWHAVNMAGATNTALYGPNDLGGGNIRAVGNYKTAVGGAHDFGVIYEGATDGSGTWTDLNIASAVNTIAHSTHGHLVVGNYDTGPESEPSTLTIGRAFVYDLEDGTSVELTIAGATSMTAYGIWDNGNGTYTIAGGYSLEPSATEVDQAYLVDWNPINNTYFNLQSYEFDNRPEADGITHFDGITGDGNGGYYLTGDYIGAGAENGLAFFAAVSRTELGAFGDATWTQLSYPSGDLTSGNSVYENYVIGVYTQDGQPVQGYVAAVPEPTTTVLIAAGGLLFFLYKRRSQSKAA